MKRINMCKKINRNNEVVFFDHIYSIIPSPLNTATPDLYINEFYVDEFDTYNGVQVVELNSTLNSASPPKEIPEYNDSQAWSYVSDGKFKELEETFRINKKTRERRRLNNQNRFETRDINSSESDEDDRYYRNGFLMSSNMDHSFNNEIKINHQTNCFRIMNEHTSESATSSEDYRNDVERLRSSEFPRLLDWSTNQYAEEMLACNDNYDIEKRSVWVYPFKKKYLLTENDFGLRNISDEETSSSSTEDVEEPVRDAKRCRVGSPIPPSFIPRLNLYPTLSTLTEITELGHPTSSNANESSIQEEELPKQKKNSWFADEDQNTQKNSSKRANSTNIINWMALSPRESRRNYLRAKSDVIVEEKIKTLAAANSSTKQKSGGDSKVPSSIKTYRVNRLSDVGSSPKDVENSSTITNVNNDEIQSYPHIGGSNIKNKGRSRKNKPDINISPKIVNDENISEPMENLEKNNWISIESKKQTATFDYELDHVVPFNNNYDINIRNNSADRLWTCMSLLEPTKSIEVEPTTETVPSLSLSLKNASHVKKSWLRRFLQIFKCCK